MKNNRNADLRAMIAAKGLCFYEVAAALNVKPNTVSQYLRKDLSDYQIDESESEEVFIDEISLQKQNEILQNQLHSHHSQHQNNNQDDNQNNHQRRRRRWLLATKA